MDTQFDSTELDASKLINRKGLQLVTYASGETIIYNGDDSNHACKLLAGTAKVIREGDVVATIRPGEYFGAIAAITGGKRSATVVAVEHCVVELIDEKDFKVMIENDPELLNKLL